MIKFFRKIRQRLLAENKLSKYLLYAIGEIILVVIGILIALQINNWNEDRKTNALEFKILKELHANLLLDLQEIEDDVDHMSQINRACQDFADYLMHEAHPSDTLYQMASILRVTPHFDPNTSGYGLLQSKGVQVISNDRLRNDISLLYERDYAYYKRYEEERLRFHALHSEPVLLEYFTMEFVPSNFSFGKFTIDQDDYDKLRGEISFNKLLAAIYFENSMVQIRAQRTASAIQDLISFLDTEIKANSEY